MGYVMEAARLQETRAARQYGVPISALDIAERSSDAFWDMLTTLLLHAAEGTDFSTTINFHISAFKIFNRMPKIRKLLGAFTATVRTCIVKLFGAADLDRKEIDTAFAKLPEIDGYFGAHLTLVISKFLPAYKTEATTSEESLKKSSASVRQHELLIACVSNTFFAQLLPMEVASIMMYAKKLRDVYQQRDIMESVPIIEAPPPPPPPPPPSYWSLMFPTNRPVASEFGRPIVPLDFKETVVLPPPPLVQQPFLLLAPPPSAFSAVKKGGRVQRSQPLWMRIQKR